ncbi:ubiquitin-specific protease doa4 [Nowakowskiella sp. JEL0407]|nr:ubiquitin-specific protease doa4 [Nowakowskiella sp. JEL0407]
MAAKRGQGKIDFLIQEALKPLNGNYSASSLLSTATKCLEEAVISKNNKKYDESFILFNRAFEIILRVAPKSKGIETQEFQMKALRKKLNSHLAICEEVKQIIMNEANDEPIPSAPSNTESPKLAALPISRSNSSNSPSLPASRIRNPSASSVSSYSSNSGRKIIGSPKLPLQQLQIQSPPNQPQPPPVNFLPPGYVPQSITAISADFLAKYISNNQAVGSQRILILDVRTVDNFMMGHVKWRPGIKNGKLAGGVVNIDPGWLTQGVNADKILEFLNQFKMSSSDPITLFEERNEFDLVIIYDQNSNSTNRSSGITTLYTVIYEWEFKKKLKNPPLMLDGGFEAWEVYVLNAKLPRGGWIEIGDDDTSHSSISSPPLNPSKITNQVSPTSFPYPIQPRGTSLQNLTNHVNGISTNGTGIARNVHEYVNQQQMGRNQPQEPTLPPQPLQTSYKKLDIPTTSFTPAFHAAFQPPLQQNQYSESDLFDSRNGFNIMSSLPRRTPTALSPPEPTALNNNVEQQASTTFAYPRLPPKTQISSVSSAQQFTVSKTLTPTPTPTQVYRPAQAVLPRQDTPTQLPPRMETQQIVPRLPAPPPIIPKKPDNLRNQAIDNSRSPSPMHQYYGNNRAIAPTTINTIDLSATKHEFTHGTVGLKNLGNTCFLNSIVQCLAATIPLARYFYDGSYKRHINRTNPLGTKGRIVDVYCELIRAMHSDERVVAPIKFKDVVGQVASQFLGNEQQDSQEFLAFLLDKLHEDLNVARKNPIARIQNDKKDENADVEDEPDHIASLKNWSMYIQTNWSIIVDIFQGQLKSRLQCLTCGKVSTTFDHFMYLTLPIPTKGNGSGRNQYVTLEDCLKKFCEEEILDGDDAWLCPRCKKRRKASKKLEIVRLPAILLVHLKRFYFQGPFRNKIETTVDFPLTDLDLTKYAPQYGATPIVTSDSTTPTSGVPQILGYGGGPGNYVYNLYAVSNHFGGLNGGHYTAQVRNMRKEQWESFDDSHVTNCSSDSVRSRAAYILFYVRVVPPGVKSVSGNWWSADAKM